MKNISTTYVAGIVSIIAFVLPIFGLDIADSGTLLNVVQGIAGVVSSLYIFYGRYKAGGISALGIRKKNSV